MFEWILIIFAIAVIFGVIKIEELKALADKTLPKLKALLSEASAKAAKFKEKLDDKDNNNNSKNDSAE